MVVLKVIYLCSLYYTFSTASPPPSLFTSYTKVRQKNPKIGPHQSPTYKIFFLFNLLSYHSREAKEEFQFKWDMMLMLFFLVYTTVVCCRIVIGRPLGKSTNGKAKAWSESSANSQWKLRTKWWINTAISILASSDPAHSRGPPPNGMKLPSLLVALPLKRLLYKTNINKIVYYIIKLEFTRVI